MGHGRVRDPITKWEVELGEVAATLGQKANSDITDIITRSQVQLLQTVDARQGLEAGVGDANAEAQVDLIDGWKPLRNVFQGFVRKFLTILKADPLQGLGPSAGLSLQSGEMANTVVWYLPTGSQVERFDLLQPPGDEEEASVGDLGAAAQLEDLQVLAVGCYPAQAAVGDLLAEAEVENLQTDDVLVESRVQGGVGQVVAAREIEALQVGHSIDQFS